MEMSATVETLVCSECHDLAYNMLQRSLSSITIDHHPDKAPMRTRREVNQEPPQTQTIANRTGMSRHLLNRHLIDIAAPVRLVIEAYLQARRGKRRNEDKIRMFLHQRSQVFSIVEPSLNIPTQSLAPLIDPAQRQFQTVSPPATLERRVRQIPTDRLLVVVAFRSRTLVEQVPGLEPVGAPKHPQVASQQERARDRDAEHLVRVRGDAVRARDACELVAVFVGEDGGAAPGAVNVHP